MRGTSVKVAVSKEQLFERIKTVNVRHDARFEAVLCEDPRDGHLVDPTAVRDRP